MENAMRDHNRMVKNESERIKKIAIERFGVSEEEIDTETRRIVKKNGNGHA